MATLLCSSSKAHISSVYCAVCSALTDDAVTIGTASLYYYVTAIVSCALCVEPVTPISNMSIISNVFNLFYAPSNQLHPEGEGSVGGRGG